MTSNGFLQLGLYLGVLLLCARPLGIFMARVYEGRTPRIVGFLRPLERLTYRLCGVDPGAEMDWRRYTVAALAFSFLSCLAVYGLQRLQGVLPLNPEGLPAVSPDSSFNTAVSFATNTNWQGYGGESTMSYLTQMLALTVQNFVTAAAGMAVLVALIRGFTRRTSATVGNFWSDLTRGTLYILLPLSLLLALVLVSQGVVQTFSPYHEVPLLEPTADADGKPVTTQKIAVGPAASQVAIKQLGTNGGGFFKGTRHIRSRTRRRCPLPGGAGDPDHPGGPLHHVRGDGRRPEAGLAVLAAMTAVFIAMPLAYWAEGRPGSRGDGRGSGRGGNMEGKATASASAGLPLWGRRRPAHPTAPSTPCTTPFTPLKGSPDAALMQLGEVIYGGVGSGSLRDAGVRHRRYLIPA
ncbi:MAG: potassium-transporting ATPase subunit KdpA [Isosphaeraceae bacterium]